MKKVKGDWEEYSNSEYPPQCNAKYVALTQNEKNWIPNSLLGQITIELTNDPDWHNGRSDFFYVKNNSDLDFLFDDKSRKLDNAKKYVIKRLKWLQKQLNKIDFDSLEGG